MCRRSWVQFQALPGRADKNICLKCWRAIANECQHWASLMIALTQYKAASCVPMLCHLHFNYNLEWDHCLTISAWERSGWCAHERGWFLLIDMGVVRGWKELAQSSCFRRAKWVFYLHVWPGICWEFVLEPTIVKWNHNNWNYLLRSRG